jgi:hypothetical protein
MWLPLALVMAEPAMGQELWFGGVPANGNGSGWTIDVTPYIWASRMKGTVGVRDRTAEVDISFRQMLEHLEGAFMLPVEARSSRWAAGLEIIYVKIGDRSATPGPLFSAAEFKAKQSIVEFGPRYRLVNARPIALDLLAGGRWWRLRNELELEAGLLPSVEVELNRSWIDAFGGVRMFIDLSQHLVLQARGDLGAGGSSFTWQALGALAYQLGQRVTLRAGYRQLDVDFEDDDNGFIYDVGTGGPIVGVTIRF